MNAYEDPEPEHRAYLCLGSNITPEDNLRQALRLLRQYTQILERSTCWETEAVSSSGVPDPSCPNFFNMAVCIATALEPQALKTELVNPIEKALGRVRSADKYAPRTIDLDIVVYDDRVLDQALWQRSYLALTLAELLPDLRHPQTGETLRDAAARLGDDHLAVPHFDFDKAV